MEAKKRSPTLILLMNEKKKEQSVDKTASSVWGKLWCFLLKAVGIPSVCSFTSFFRQPPRSFLCYQLALINAIWGRRKYLDAYPPPASHFPKLCNMVGSWQLYQLHYINYVARPWALTTFI